ncbi:MAG: type I restriction enzyme HsdR N-terminal domain-containing protein [Muribaculaceae bacterium]|nr:type I restriction enzyme HsdR N-terminal domain-containing protein [Muribaculaceae bacterium]
MKLNLPDTKLNIQNGADGVCRVFDRLRRKYVALTPEEWVRQHFVAYLIDCLGYNQSLMANETGIVQNGIRRRCDTVVFDSHGRPAVIVEYKAPAVGVTQRVFDQIVRYNMVLHAPVLIVSNGLAHYCCLMDAVAGNYRFLDSVPDWRALKKIVESRSSVS